MMCGDINGDGTISLNEFLQCAIDFNIFIYEDYLRQAFDHFDADKSGEIDHHELYQLISEGGKDLNI